jgi:hypothetical protein
MKVIYQIHHKAKPAILLMVVVAIILGSSFLEKRLMKDMNTSVSSIYKDRLVPAAELFQINDLMYSKRLVLERYLVHPSASNAEQVTQKLADYNAQINTIVKQFETTYLVDEESRSFGEFKAKMQEYNALERKLLAASGNMQLINSNPETEIARVFKGIHQELVLLSNIQTKVGHDLLDGSESIKGSASILSNLQIALVLIITLVVQQALLTDRHPLVPKNLKNFGLN